MSPDSPSAPRRQLMATSGWERSSVSTKPPSTITSSGSCSASFSAAMTSFAAATERSGSNVPPASTAIFKPMAVSFRSAFEVLSLCCTFCVQRSGTQAASELACESRLLDEGDGYLLPVRQAAYSAPRSVSFKNATASRNARSATWSSANDTSMRARPARSSAHSLVPTIGRSRGMGSA